MLLPLQGLVGRFAEEPAVVTGETSELDEAAGERNARHGLIRGRGAKQQSVCSVQAEKLDVADRRRVFLPQLGSTEVMAALTPGSYGCVWRRLTAST